MESSSALAISYQPNSWVDLRTLTFHALLCTVCPHLLTLTEASDIIQQFEGGEWLPDKQVFWTGVSYDKAQEWAKAHRMQTLTIAMGPLMNSQHPACLKLRKSTKTWSRYIKGASLIFAWRVSQGRATIVLTPPPPERFHPSGMTRYQVIEEPVLKGRLSGQSVGRIMAVHPMVKGAENFEPYEIWPKDDTASWMKVFGTKAHSKTKWRAVSETEAPANWAVAAVVNRQQPSLEEPGPSFDEDAPRLLDVVAYGCLIFTEAFINLLLVLVVLAQALTHASPLYGVRLGGRGGISGGEARMTQEKEAPKHTTLAELNTNEITCLESNLASSSSLSSTPGSAAFSSGSDAWEKISQTPKDMATQTTFVPPVHSSPVECSVCSERTRKREEKRARKMAICEEQNKAQDKTALQKRPKKKFKKALKKAIETPLPPSTVASD